MRDSVTISKVLAARIKGIDTEERLYNAFEAVEFIPLDNGAKLATKPGGATYHFCIEGETGTVANVIARLKAGETVITDLPSEVIKML